MEKEVINGRKFWNEAYAGVNGGKLPIEYLQLPQSMNDIAKKFLDNTTCVLDFGCGGGEFLMRLASQPNFKKGFGVENGSNIVKYTSGVVKANGFDEKITILDGGVTSLNDLNNVDGIIISNVLDVITLDDANVIMESLVSILKSKDLVILKINPYMSHDDLIKKGFVNFKENLYSRDDILRVRLLSTEEWRKWFNKWFNELDYIDVEWQAPGFFDRLFLLERK